MRRALVAAALVACGHGSAPKGPEHDLDVATPAVALIDAAPAAPHATPVAALAGDGPHAFVADAGGLLEVAPDGKTQPIAAAKPGWCSADARANVVWFTGDDGLYAFDLADRVVHPIVRGQLDADTVEIDWGNEQLGGGDKVDYQIALAIYMTGAVKAGSELGCDGDQAVYCYEDNGETLRPDLLEKQKKVDAAQLDDAAYVKALAARGKDRSLWTPPPVPPAAPAKKPKVAKKPCEEDAKDCGALTAIPGSALWLVETANSRGDFYHETRELWDPADGAFVFVANGKVVRSMKPQLGDSDYRDLRIAPSGGLLSIGGVVFDPTHVVYAPAGDDALTCGWSTGGWRIKSPTE